MIKMKKIVLTLGTATLVLGGLFMLPNVAEAYRGDPNVKGPEYTEERHQEMKQSFETNNYEAWKNLMQGKGRVIQFVNEDNFARFTEAHKLAEEGKMDEAMQIRQELGLGLGNKSGNGEGQGTGQGRKWER